MKKLRIGVVFGGMSTENKVSCVSANSVIKNLNKEKYDIFPIYIDKKGNWFEVTNIDIDEKTLEESENKIYINNVMELLKTFNVVFPVLHGLYGEDGTIQGFLNY